MEKLDRDDTMLRLLHKVIDALDLDCSRPGLLLTKHIRSRPLTFLPRSDVLALPLGFALLGSGFCGSGSLFPLSLHETQAIVFYELAFHFNPHCAEACNNLGVIYKDRDNLDKAVEGYQDSRNKFRTGVLYRDAGSISLAIEAYEQCLKIDPDSHNAGQYCGKHYAALMGAEMNHAKEKVIMRRPILGHMIFLQKEIVDRSCGNNSLHIETRPIEDDLVFYSFVQIHSQFSTNTFPSWDRAQTMRVIAYKRSVKYEP
ncbi:hypothetical protein L6452_13877 [Arctium lappa]|uniref:Uncharacterized protein n=1 Tax=Arctium lappa TaxID=4217 RepID=A0ACB9CJE4_ARCLA|nr:hypothetical protein L6452_13877 [Arctium lappa]